MDPIFFYQDPRGAPGTAGPRAAGRDVHAPSVDSEGDGRLRGLSVALQPNISVRGWPTDAGSHALAGFSALEDATVVRRLREGGASVVGSTHMSEFGLGLEGSQAGAAVRDGLAGVELVLDLAGEARLAAARAGVCALKPSYGLLSRFGLVDLIPSMEACAILAADPESIGRILAAIAGPDELDSSLPDDAAIDLSPQTFDPAATSVGVIAEALADLPAAQEEGFHASLEAFRARGIAVREVSLPDFSLFSLVHQIVGSVEASSCTGRYDSVRYGPRAPGAKNWNEMYLSSREASFGTPLKSYLLQGAFFQFERYQAFEDACRLRGRLVEDMSRLTAEVDFLALPLGGALPSSADPYSGSALTLSANVTGQPAFYLPSGAGDGRQGLQLLGPRLSDGRLLALAELLLGDVGAGGGE
jgi:aspartyl-tRNA(Asn)/glutamyl-tRNA(Gln) amidotransferase subunit A